MKTWVRRSITTLASLIVGGALGFAIGLSQGMKASADWSSLVALGGLSLAETSATEVYLNGDYRDARASLLSLISQASELESHLGNEEALVNSVYHARAFAYARLALLESRHGTTDQSRAYMQFALKEAQLGGWKSPTEDRIVALVTRMDRLAAPTPVPTPAIPGA